MYNKGLRMRILNFGSLNFDHVYTVPHIAAAGETILAAKLERYLGGKGLNQSIAIARAGSQIFHGGAVGSDGEAFVSFCTENGVETEYLELIAEVSGHAMIQVDAAGENCIVLYSGANKMQTKEHIDQVLQNFGAGDILVLQNEINELPYLIEKAYGLGMRTVLNPSPFDSQVAECDLNKTEFLLLNEVEGEQIAGHKAPEEILKYLRSHFPRVKVVLTLGGQGAVYQDENQTVRQCAFSVPVIDTTAAGDTFTGYFVHGIAQQYSIPKAMELAAKAAAIAVSRKGATSSIPYAAEVECCQL